MIPDCTDVRYSIGEQTARPGIQMGCASRFIILRGLLWWAMFPWQRTRDRHFSCHLCSKTYREYSDIIHISLATEGSCHDDHYQLHAGSTEASRHCTGYALESGYWNHIKSHHIMSYHAASHRITSLGFNHQAPECNQWEGDCKSGLCLQSSVCGVMCARSRLMQLMLQSRRRWLEQSWLWVLTGERQTDNCFIYSTPSNRTLFRLSEDM